MSRNQAKYCIRKGRTCVDGKVIIDPNFEISDSHTVTFDSNPISIVNYQYFMLNKPASFVCTTAELESNSVLNLIPNQSKEKKYYLIQQINLTNQQKLYLILTFINTPNIHIQL